MIFFYSKTKLYEFIDAVFEGNLVFETKISLKTVKNAIYNEFTTLIQLKFG